MMRWNILNKKGNILIGIFLILCSGCAKKVDREFEKYFVPIDFPTYGSEFNDDLKVEFDAQKIEIENENILNEIWIARKNNTDEIIKKLCEIENIDYSEGKKLEDSWSVTNYEKSIIKYNDSSFVFRCSKEIDEPVTVEDDTCIQMAREYLASLNIDIADMTNVEMKYDVLETVEGEEIVSKIVEFTRQIDDVEVRGSAKIFFSYVGNGILKTFYYGVHSDITSIEVPKEKVKEIEEAVAEIENNQGMLDIPEEATKIVVNRIECIYWEDAAPGTDNEIIQPIYKITGDAYDGSSLCGTFEVLESALSE